MKTNASKLGLIASAPLTAGALAMAWRVVLRRRSEPVVADAMTGQPVWLDARASAQSAAARMAEEGIGALAVCDDRDQPVGVITDRDLVVRLLAQGEDPSRTTLGDCLAGEVETVDAEMPLSQAAARMEAMAVRRLPVLRAGRLAGILTVADITECDPATAVSLERALTRARPDERSAAWLFRKPYRRTEMRAVDAARASRRNDGQLTAAAREMLAAKRADAT